MPYSSPTISHRQLAGWQALTLENDLLRVTLLPEKGSDIVEFVYKPHDLDFLWKAPWGLPPKPDSPLPRDGFMDFYEGGWQEILPSGGLPNTYSGVEYGLHGELWSLPWDVQVESDSKDRVSVMLKCRLTTLPLSLQKRLTLVRGESRLHIDETLTNESDRPVDFMWGHHPALGAPFLNENCILQVPAANMEVASVEAVPGDRLQSGTKHRWPVVTGKDGHPLDLQIIPPPSSKCSDEFWLSGLTDGWFAVTDTRSKIGFGMTWDPQVFRGAWVWQEFGGTREAPWNGETYVMAVEPYSSYAINGLSGAVQRGEHLTIPARGRIETWLKAAAYQGVDRVGAS